MDPNYTSSKGACGIFTRVREQQCTVIIVLKCSAHVLECLYAHTKRLGHDHVSVCAFSKARFHQRMGECGMWVYEPACSVSAQLFHSKMLEPEVC